MEIKGLNKNFSDKEVLKNINLNIKSGTIFGIIGENGAGKTTLIKCLTGIFKPDSGSIKINGKEVFENIDVKKTIGYVADENSYFPTFKIKDLVKFYKMTYDSFSESRFKELNEIFKIPENKMVFQMSKGMKMRLSIMLNLSLMPEVLILDEPTSGLDPIIKKKVINLLLDEVVERGTTIFISSHHLSELERICDSIAIINEGKIEFVDDIENMKKKIRKLQVVFNKETPEDLEKWNEVLKVETMGRVTYIITKEYSKQLEERLMKSGAMFVEEIDLSLEDMFIYSVEEMKNYEKVLA